MKYFIVLNNEKIGPLSFDETIEMGLSRDMLVWREGLPDWQTAMDIREFHDYFLALPPDLPKNTDLKDSKDKIVPGVLYALSFTTLLTLIFFAVYFYSNSPNQNTSFSTNSKTFKLTESQFFEEEKNDSNTTISNSTRYVDKQPKVSSSENTSKSTLKEKLNQFSIPQTITRSGQSDIRMGEKSKYDEGFNPMYKDQNLYRENRFKDDIKTKTSSVFLFLFVLSILAFLVFYFVKK